MTELNNGDVARALDQIGDILEIKGENRFRIIGYRRGAEALRNLGRDVREVWRAGELRTVPGIGEALAEKIDELLRTGRLGYLERLEAEIPSGVVSLLRIPDIGPSKARAMWDSLGIASIDDAEQAARDGKLRELPGFGAKTEEKILAGIETLRRRGEAGRRPLGDVLPIARSLLATLRDAAPGIVQAEVGGSVRRWRDTIGDVDLLAASTDPEAVMAAFRSLPQVSAVLGTGPTKTSVRLHNELQVDLRVVPPERWGTALQYFTGSQSHNVELRELALKQGWSLNEYALTSTKTGEERTFADEESLYAALGLDWMPPEMREGRGEIAAARAHRLPRLVTLGDILGELHAHSTWSDGKNTVAQMAAAAAARGYRYFALTDHSQSLGITGGMNEEAWRAQHVEIEAARLELPGLLLLHGAEVEVRPDGALDYPDALLEEMDLVVAAVHVSHRQPAEQITARALGAVGNPHVDVLAHPSGRLIGRRDPSEVDLEQVIQAAARSGTLMEINANPVRLDLDDVHARRAVELGVPLVINTDAHSPGEMDFLEYGVATARRAWATKADVFNAWEPDRVALYLKERKR